jgi:hypothetical protein
MIIKLQVYRLAHKMSFASKVKGTVSLLSERRRRLTYASRQK